MAAKNMDEECLFCRIAKGETPSHLVYEDDQVVCFLDICPIRRGHAQIVPRAHHPYFESLPAELAASVMFLGQRLATGMKRLYQVKRVAFLFSGGDIDHAHAHLVPMHHPTDITSRRYIVEEKLTFRNTPRPPDEELAEVAGELRGALVAAA